MSIVQKYCYGNLSFVNNTWRSLYEGFKGIIQFTHCGFMYQYAVITRNYDE
ncbi:hypothetical protein XNC1_0977 [Xenorhabdus nematophila ATCC 19061]|uniref:Uncharacterized protein n=1 Tax=Xenorhabdus nematophila (strain ATCC 19061 / DSM 3370 / CCUG 14189 / LMG 1036 / NCIMB 9965 / AN6) TaxID=406817 RepID=D3VL89_XENNA|nr:hypothetical protein XNC1_0977 [Xenorhabdus nematophila ATCC 19061]